MTTTQQEILDTMNSLKCLVPKFLTDEQKVAVLMRLGAERYQYTGYEELYNLAVFSYGFVANKQGKL